ncbi:hypothetical protein [Cryobacterium sp. GrIS_2_6]|uniref:hypothetical protein n=1 Tax=Cryobacterium sp. GrIS_2_6 TaxID=3162785 RepID=UPI002DFB9BEC|nr:hypothetical protein [Cryobacterium psychrotolerans]
MTSAGLDSRAPLIRLWQFVGDQPEERDVLVEPDETSAAETTKDEYKMRRHRITIEVPTMRETRQDTMLLGYP